MESLEHPPTVIPDDFLALLPQVKVAKESGPVYYLWVFDPHTGAVHVEHNEGRHKAEHLDHGHMAEKVQHPERIHGFAYRIKGGWRITTWEHRAVDDPFIFNAVKRALGHE